MRKMLVIIVLALLSACSSAPQAPSDVTAISGEARLAITYGTLSYIDDDEAKAERVLSYAGDIEKALDASKVVTIRGAEEALRSSIDWASLDTADKVLLDALLVELRAYLEANLTATQLSEKTTLLAVTRAVTDAARLVAGSS